MKQKTKASFDTRAFVALTAIITGLGLPVSGYVNHLYQMDPMTIQRHAWMAVHNVLGVIFTIFTIWHILLNRRALFNHVKGIATRMPLIHREAISATGVVLIGLLYAGHVFMVH